MTLWRRVTPGIVRVSLVSAFAGTIATLVCTVLFSLTAISAHFPTVVEQMETLAERCAAHPEGFTTEVSTGDLIRTWDIDRIPQGAAGPDPKLLKTLRDGAPSAMRLRFLQRYGGILLYRRAQSGPCSLVEVSWRIDPIARGGLLGMALLLALVSAVLSGLLSALVVVRPVIGRVQRLGRAAAQVGDDSGYASALEADDDELGLLSKQLDAAHERIRSATQALIDRNRNLESNLADVAHDLKTPLSAVQLTLESLAGTRHRDAGREADQETLRRCLDDCVYLAEMIDNLRVGSQLAEGVSPDADGARAEAREIVGQVVRRLRPLARFRGVELDRSDPDREVWIRCRPLALERVVDNLVANAVRHGRPGGHVAVLLEADDAAFQLTVLDDGPGVSDEERAAMSRRGFRGWGADRRSPQGTGLGLAIVTEVCHRCGWSLRFDPNEPSGLRVVVQGPVVRQNEREVRALHTSSKVAP